MFWCTVGRYNSEVAEHSTTTSNEQRGKLYRSRIDIRRRTRIWVIRAELIERHDRLPRHNLHLLFTTTGTTATGSDPSRDAFESHGELFFDFLLSQCVSDVYYPAAKRACAGAQYKAGDVFTRITVISPYFGVQLRLMVKQKRLVSYRPCEHR